MYAKESSECEGFGGLVCVRFNRNYFIHSQFLSLVYNSTFGSAFFFGSDRTESVLAKEKV